MDGRTDDDRKTLMVDGIAAGSGAAGLGLTLGNKMAPILNLYWKIIIAKLFKGEMEQ